MFHIGSPYFYCYQKIGFTGNQDALPMTFLQEEMEAVSKLLDASALQLLPGWAPLTLGVDQSATAIVLLAADGVIRHANPAAIMALARSNILHVRSGRIHLNRREERLALRLAIEFAARASDGTGEQPAEMVVLHNRQQCPVMALHLRQLVGPGLPTMISVRIADMLTPAAIDPAWITRVFRLTQAEARVAAGLFDGMDLREIAERQTVALETVRGHLKRGMIKVGARSQAQLVRMLASSQGLIDPDIAASSDRSSVRKNRSSA